MYHESTDEVKTFPLPDTHLHGAAVLACNVIDQEEATNQLKELVPILRGLVAEFKAVSRWMVEEVSDLLTRQDTALQLAVAAREHPDQVFCSDNAAVVIIYIVRSIDSKVECQLQTGPLGCVVVGAVIHLLVKSMVPAEQ